MCTWCWKGALPAPYSAMMPAALADLLEKLTADSPAPAS